ncbi:MAG: hypothetical protein EZS28_007246 [Streblomastix strix]|uniref:Uncharacterized protein n=1 Tax=Streblomastix strix TaxID=222440 RepID=A0A5J4WSZ6_9EUKA|nr:MAG: hypothetical protein EZS28_007246 [Streblomastix strix]
MTLYDADAVVSNSTRGIIDYRPAQYLRGILDWTNKFANKLLMDKRTAELRIAYDRTMRLRLCGLVRIFDQEMQPLSDSYERQSQNSYQLKLGISSTTELGELNASHASNIRNWFKVVYSADLVNGSARPCESCQIQIKKYKKSQGTICNCICWSQVTSSTENVRAVTMLMLFRNSFAFTDLLRIPAVKAETLRIEACNYALVHVDQFQRFFVDGEDSVHYVHQMSNEGEYGDDRLFMAIFAVYHMWVHAQMVGGITFVERNQNKRVIQVGYLTNIYYVSNRYD